jgi:hypothetical protein
MMLHLLKNFVIELGNSGALRGSIVFPQHGTIYGAAASYLT